MSQQFVSSDVAILDLLRKRPTMSVTEMADCLEVTATAVRQRLTRLMAQGYVERSTEKAGRGRPSHRYALTPKGRRKTGSNFADLAVALWQEIRQIKDPEVRRGLFQRLAKRLAEMYADRIEGDTTEERMRSLARLLGERNVPFSVDAEGERHGQSGHGRGEADERLPVLTALACPYPELAEQDRTICAMEKLLFAELLDRDLRLTNCRLDGGSCCTFEVN